MYQQIICTRHTVQGTSYDYLGGEGFGYLKLHTQTETEMVEGLSWWARCHSAEWDYEHVTQYHEVLDLLREFNIPRIRRRVCGE